MNKTKSIFIVLLPILSILIGLNSCFQKPVKEDSKEISDEENDKKFKTVAAEKDARFVVDIIACNMAELKIATLGEQQVKNTDVREIATLLKEQQLEILSKFKMYASLKRISIPTELTSEAKEEENEVRNDRDEKDFDKEWCNDVKKMHEGCLKKMERASTEVTDPELKDLASETLPTIRLHYDKIIACEDRFISN